jgi:hypothetical protein
MTEDEADFLGAVWRETRGKPEEWLAVTELPATALALSRNGYIQVREAGPDTWRVVLTVEGAGIASALFPNPS